MKLKGRKNDHKILDKTKNNSNNHSNTLNGHYNADNRQASCSSIR